MLKAKTRDGVWCCLSLTASLCNSKENVLDVSGRCYWKITEPLNFTDAHRRCQAEGGILAEIPDEEAQIAIYCSVKLTNRAEIPDQDSQPKIE